MINKNKLFRQAHIYVSLFFLPCALLFAITGIAYIFGLNQDAGLKQEKFVLSKNIQKGEEQSVLLEFLKENKLKIPSNTELKINKRDGSFEMGGTHYSVSLKNKGDIYEVSLKTRSFLGDMIMLHKDKAGWYFSVLSVGFGLCLLMLYFSGLMITLFASKKDRNKQYFVLGTGFLITILLAYLSL